MGRQREEEKEKSHVREQAQAGPAQGRRLNSIQGKLKTWLKEKTGLLPTKCHGWGGGDLRAGGPSVSDLNSLPRKSGINLTQSPEEHFKLNLRC